MALTIFDADERPGSGGYIVLTHQNCGRWRAVEGHRSDYAALSTLGPAARLLNCPVDGLATRSKEEFAALAARYASAGKTVVIAAGDGGFGDVCTAVPRGSRLAYLPGGTGCAMGYVASYPKDSRVRDLAQRILDGSYHALDLIDIRRQSAIFTSIGIDALVLEKRERHMRLPHKQSYARAMLGAIVEYKGNDMELDLDGRKQEFPGVTSLIVTKIPYYGFGLKIAPHAKTGDGKLHVYVLRGALKSAGAFITSFLGGNRFGSHLTGEHLAVKTERETGLQINGDLQEGKSDNFEFAINPAKVFLRY